MMIAKMQGSLPEKMHVKKPEGDESFSVSNYLGYVRHVKKQFTDEFAAGPDTYPDPVMHCDLCNWWE
jgi:uncharacterized protein